MASPGHSGHTATITPFDFGIKDLLHVGNSVTDDEAFWAEFSKYEAKSRTDLTKKSTRLSFTANRNTELLILEKPALTLAS